MGRECILEIPEVVNDNAQGWSPRALLTTEGFLIKCYLPWYKLFVTQPLVFTVLTHSVRR